MKISWILCCKTVPPPTLLKMNMWDIESRSESFLRNPFQLILVINQPIYFIWLLICCPIYPAYGHEFVTMYLQNMTKIRYWLVAQSCIVSANYIIFVIISIVFNLMWYLIRNMLVWYKVCHTELVYDVSYHSLRYTDAII